jgi:hypothetical protein
MSVGKKINLDVLKRIGGNILAFIVFYAVLMAVLGVIYTVSYAVASGRDNEAASIVRFGISGAEYWDFLVLFGWKPLVGLLWTLAGAAVLVLPALAFRGVYLEINKK